MKTTATNAAWFCALLLLGCPSSQSTPAGTTKSGAGTGGEGTVGTNGDAGATAGRGDTSSGGQSGTGGRVAGTGGRAADTGGNTAGTGGGVAGAGGHIAGTGGNIAGTGGSSAGTGGSTNMATGGTSGQSCPPECLRAYECAASCDDTPTNNGCCPCPDGTIDVITCPAKNAPAYCGLPCTGAAPSPEVAKACAAFTTQKDCAAYQSDKFPNMCAWLVPPIAPCLVP